MNRKKILGIIFVIAALVCLHGFSTAMSREDGHTTKTMEQIEKAVFLQNGKVDKDNEGKPVIVRGKLHTAKSCLLYTSFLWSGSAGSPRRNR